MPGSATLDEVASVEAPMMSGCASVATGRLRLETRRLTLRPLCEDDLDEMCLLLGDGDALALWGVPLDRDGARRWIERNMTRYQADGLGRCAVVLRATGRLVGDCGLIRTTVEGVPEVELGWIVRRAHWGMGIATEAARAWRDHAFTELGLDRIVSMISEQNIASRRVAEKLGMTIERTAVWHGLPMLMYACVGPVPAGNDAVAWISSSRAGHIPACRAGASLSSDSRLRRTGARASKSAA
jgi:[ribosomal protein S5]-alanine N-acetyltransferase